MSLYFIIKIWQNSQQILNDFSEFSPQFFKTSKVFCLNPFLLKESNSHLILSNLKKVSDFKQTHHGRFIFVPLVDFKNTEINFAENVYKDNGTIITKINSDFHNDNSFNPLLTNLVFFVKAQKIKLSESKFSSRINQKILFSNLLKTSSSGRISRAPLLKPNYLSSSFEFFKSKNVVSSLAENVQKKPIGIDFSRDSKRTPVSGVRKPLDWIENWRISHKNVNHKETWKEAAINVTVKTGTNNGGVRVTKKSTSRSKLPFLKLGNHVFKPQNKISNLSNSMKIENLGEGVFSTRKLLLKKSAFKS